MSNILLTIIIPCFNAECYIESTLNSITSQMKDSVELIIIDDGSTDNTAKIIFEFQKKYKGNIVYYKQENRGASSARNNGINYAQGQYIWFIDSDDYIVNGAIDYILERILKGSPDLIHFNFNYLKDREKRINKSQLVFEGKGQDFINKALLQDKLSITTWSNVINLDFLKNSKVLFTEGIVVEDEEFYLKLFCLANNIVSVNTSLYLYIIRQDSIAHNVKNLQKRTKSKFVIFKNMQSFILENQSILNRTKNTINTYLAFLILFDYCLIDNENKDKKLLKKEIKNMKLEKYIQSKILKYKIFKLIYMVCPNLLLSILSSYLRRRS